MPTPQDNKSPLLRPEILLHDPIPLDGDGGFLFNYLRTRVFPRIPLPELLANLPRIHVVFPVLPWTPSQLELRRHPRTTDTAIIDLPALWTYYEQLLTEKKAVHDDPNSRLRL